MMAPITRGMPNGICQCPKAEECRQWLKIESLQGLYGFVRN